MKLLEINNTLFEGVDNLKASISDCRKIGMSIQTVMEGINSTDEQSLARHRSAVILGISEEALGDLDKTQLLSHLTDKYIEAVCSTITKFTSVYAAQAESIAIIKESLDSIEGISDEQFANVSATIPDYIWLSDMFETFTGEVNLIKVVEAGVNGAMSGQSYETSFAEILEELNTLGLSCSDSVIHSDHNFMNEGTFASAMYRSKEDLEKGAEHAAALLSFGEGLKQLKDGDIINVIDTAIHMGNDTDKTAFTQASNITTMLNLMCTMLKMSVEVPYAMAIALAKTKLS